MKTSAVRAGFPVSERLLGLKLLLAGQRQAGPHFFVIAACITIPAITPKRKITSKAGDSLST
jgi:hypothetical protein